jgi:hypothetical protein
VPVAVCQFSEELIIMRSLDMKRGVGRVTLEIGGVIWLVGYLSILVFYPYLGDVVNQAAESTGPTILLWIATIGLPLIPTIIFFHFAGETKNVSNMYLVWMFLGNFVLWLGLATIVLTMVFGGDWIKIINMNSPVVPALPGY